MTLEIVTFNNFKEAIKIQREIFPKEDGTINILASLNREEFMEKTGLFYVDDNVKYYLAKVDNVTIGITGLYDYQNKDEVWLGWFGILPNYRGQGYGSLLLQKTIKLAQKKGYKVIRLYTDSIENKEAIKLYLKNGFIGEKYSLEDLDYDCYIYSKSLTNEELTMWNNKNLNLSYQSELDQMNEEEIANILKKYES